jgi:uncharacterized membrane protein YjfL (UPF0719 family)
VTAPEPEIIPAKQARAAIQAKIVETLGADYERDWLTIHNADYLVRLNKGAINLDFQCDLLGHVEVIERPVNPLQASGRFIAWTILAASMFIAIFIAIATGVLK